MNKINLMKMMILQIDQAIKMKIPVLKKNVLPQKMNKLKMMAQL